MKALWRGRRGRVRAVSLLAAAFLVTGGFALQARAQAEQYARLLENQRRHAFAELTAAAGELDTALRKASLAATPALFASQCTQAYAKAQAAQMALGELPYGNVELEQTAAFLAKAGDYAMSLARGAWGEAVCSAEEREGLCAYSTAASTLAQTLGELQLQVGAGDVSLEDLAAVQARLSAGQGEEALTAGSAFQTVEADFPEVPALVYDGPFSQHLTGRTPRMLEGLPQVDEETARQAAAQFLNLRPEIFTCSDQGEGPLPTWGFTAAVEGGELYVEVTRQGAQVLQVLSSRPLGTARLDREEALQAASEFLEERGYSDMLSSYSMAQNGILTIHFAAVQDGVYCYPDLVKVGVALDNGGVVSFEAQGYLTHHGSRELLEAAVSEDEAGRLVDGSLEVLSHQLALIPTAGEYEVLCHEFKCQAEDGSHVLVYVNAATGQEEKILLLLEDENGTLTL